MGHPPGGGVGSSSRRGPTDHPKPCSGERCPAPADDAMLAHATTRPPTSAPGGPPAALLAALITLLLADQGLPRDATPCWRQRGPRDPCLPIPRAMMEVLEAGGQDLVRAILPSQVVRVPEFGKPKMRSQRHILTFKIPDAKNGERLKSAELRLALPWNLSNHRTLAKSGMAHVFLVPKDEDSNSQATIRLDSIPINYPPRDHYNSSLNVTPTLSLNVTGALFYDSRTNEHGDNSNGSTGHLRLEVHLQGHDNAMISVIPADYDNHIPQEILDPPQLLLFYSLGVKPRKLHSSDTYRKGRWRRSIKDEYEEETNMIWNRVADFPRTKEMSGVKKKSPRNSCRRQPLYVDFAEINYDTWIVAPNGYEAYQCVGKCFFPVSEHLSPTKHAILQTLVHSVSPRKAARACCVPTRLESISVLYVDPNGVLTYHFNYEDMVVAECGCR